MHIDSQHCHFCGTQRDTEQVKPSPEMAIIAKRDHITRIKPCSLCETIVWDGRKIRVFNGSLNPTPVQH